MPAGSINFIAEEFHVSNDYQKVLPISVFLIGYIVGPLFLAPMSEIYGRRPLLLYTFLLFFCFTLGTALVSNFLGLLILRFLAGTAAAAPLTVVGALYADCFPDKAQRGRFLALWSSGTTFGPTLAPMISGFLGEVSWRWPFWFQVILGGVALIFLVFLPETFAPVLLAKRAAKLRKEQNRSDIVGPEPVHNARLKQLFSANLTRPVTMFFTEPLVALVSLYLAYLYAMLYLFFQAYPIIFQGKANSTSGRTALSFSRQC